MRKKPAIRRPTWSTADWVVWVEDGEVRHYPVDSERGREIVAEIGGEIIPARSRAARSISQFVEPAPAPDLGQQLELFPEDRP